MRRLLDRAREEALGAFDRAGLPRTPGVFGFDPQGGEWVLLGSSASVRERWNHVLTHPPEAGWRYAGLAQIGRRERPDDPIVALAADLLDQIAAIEARLDSDLAGGGADASGRHDLEVAFELTMTWMRLVEAVSPPLLAAPPKPLRSRKARAAKGSSEKGLANETAPSRQRKRPSS